jgi:Cu(I)/Ag(I) efflux system membrane fusion protein
MNKLIQNIKEFWQSAYRWPVVIVVIVVFIIGLLIGGGSGDEVSHAGDEHGTESQAKTAKEQIWTCSMHPQIRQPKPGKCPICFMDLVPVESSAEEELGPRQLKLTPTAMKLAEVQTAPVERRFAANEIRMKGKVVYDETQLRNITARVPGRIDRMYVDYTGIQVRKGDHLVSLYSPELITAQQELLQSLKSYKKFGSGRSLAAAARDKLGLWGLTKEQIKEIEKRGKPTDHLTIYSPMNGIVVQKHAVEGMYVNTGTPFYTIADLSRVWVKLDAYESDLSWIRYGQSVVFESEAYPGEIFNGRIAFIDPVLNAKTRTVKVRLNVPNPEYKLKPEMFVRAVVRSKLSMSGKVMDPELAGKWISPMHPEIVKDGPGTCDVCGMPLVKAEDLGFIAVSTADQEAPLVVPASAPLITGKRAVVYIAVAGKEGVFEGREIVLGPRAGDYYLVKEGLQKGDKVVVNGAFKIDSDLQIQAKPSMMSIIHETHEKHEKQKQPEMSKISTAFQESIDAVADAYFTIQYDLSSDSLEEAKKSSEKLLEKLAAVDMNLLTGNAHMEWMKQEKILKEASQKLAKANDIEAARVQLEILTGPMTVVIKTFSSMKTPVYRFHCPMAFDNKGAYWLQNNKETRNPYFGASMLLCKDSVEPLVTEDGRQKTEDRRQMTDDG